MGKNNTPVYSMKVASCRPVFEIAFNVFFKLVLNK